MSIKTSIKNAIPNPLKCMMNDALRPFGMPPQSVRNLLACQGMFTVQVEGRPLRLSHTNRWIENDVFWKGIKGYEPHSMSFWLRAAKNAKSILDIGANSGLFALTARTVNPDAKVYAFEPLPNFRSILIKNRDANNYGKEIHVSEYAVSDFIGDATFYVPQENQGNIYSSSLSREHYNAHQQTVAIELPVKVTTIDLFASQNAIESVDLVKIDAEGHDLNVLKGMARLLEKSRPDFLIEVHSDETGRQIMELLPSHTYAYYNIDEEKGARRSDILTASDTFNFFICKHETAQTITL